MFEVRLWITTSHCRWPIRNLPSTLHALYSPCTALRTFTPPQGSTRDLWTVWRCLSSGMLCHVVWYILTDVSEVRNTNIFRSIIEELIASEMSVNFYQTRLSNIPGDKSSWGSNVIDGKNTHTHTHTHIHKHSDAIFLWNMERGQKCNRIYTCSITVTCSLEGHNITSASQVISLLWFQTFMQCLRFKFIKEDDRWGWS
jgi:hypothetical protein